MPKRSVRIAMAAAGGVLALLLVACSSSTASTPTTRGTQPPQPTTTTANSGNSDGPAVPIVFNGQGNNLVAYETTPPFTSQDVITNADDDPVEGLDINGQICTWNDGDETFIVAGEDTSQPIPPAGWGIFRIDGNRVGSLRAWQVGKLTPTYQSDDDAGADQPENYGCGLLSDGRIVTTDVGNTATGPGTGQLIMWYPRFDADRVDFCKLDVGIGTAQQILVDADDNIYVASARGGGTDRPAAVYKYSGPFPTGDTAEDGCHGFDSTSAPMVEKINREVFIPAGENGLATPAGIAPKPEGGFYVSSVFNGYINEYDQSGAFVRTILKPPDGEAVGAKPISTGTPLGLGVGPDGTIYYADLGLVVSFEDGETNIGPGDNTGSVRRIAIVDGEPQAPEIMDDGLPFPDGIGVWLAALSGGGSGIRP